jgi:hypothetical protein
LPPEHIERPTVPGTAERITECGCPIAGLDVLTRHDWAARVRHRGPDRARVGACPDCIVAAEHALTLPFIACTATPTADLLALAELVRRHHDEFAALRLQLIKTWLHNPRRLRRRHR